jgi:large subunit ribosomal protein L29
MGKTTTASELREMSDEQLALTLKESTESLFRLRLQAETERLDAPSELKRHRRLIARVKTIQGQRARAAAAKPPAPAAAPAEPSNEA